jgi:HK97 family phage major capsid protein
MNRPRIHAAGSAAAIFAASIGPRPVAEAPDRPGGLAEFLDHAEKHHNELKSLFSGTADKIGALDIAVKEQSLRLSDVEQRMSRPGLHGGRAVEAKSWGESLVESDEFKALAGSSSQRGRARVEVKNILSGSTSGGPLVAPDYRPDAVMLPKRTMTVRNLVAPGRTSGNLVNYPRQTVRTNNAAVVAEGVKKPESDIQFELVGAPVRTIAHFVKASRQIIDDAPALQSTVDTELRYGLQFNEEAELLYGDGTGQHLLGLIPQATAFTAPFAVVDETAIDRIGLALAQAEGALLPATGIVLHPYDWRKIRMTKDGMGRYILGDPAMDVPTVIWNTPVAVTLAITAGTFLVGAFRDGAQIFDRLDAEVLISTENEDDFVKNLVTVRGEERLAFTVKRPQAFVTGTLP